MGNRCMKERAKRRSGHWHHRLSVKVKKGCHMGLREELQAVWDRYLDAYRTGDASGCAAVFSADATLASPYAPLAQGQEAIRELHQDWTSDGGENKRLDMIAHGGSGDFAWCLANYSEGAETGDGVSLSVLERQADGQWLIKMCSLNEADPA